MNEAKERYRRVQTRFYKEVTRFEKTLGKIEGRRRRGRQRTRWLDGITDSVEFEQAPGDGAGQGSLACCSLWGHKASDMTE